MMDPAVKTAMALCVLVAGVCAAMLFRREPVHVNAPPPPSPIELLIRSRAAAIASRTSAAKKPAATDSNSRAATVITPWDHADSPPPLADSYPQVEHPASSRWGMSMDMVLPAAGPADELPRTHKIVDGDSLASLAERYLGEADRGGEIFAANRDVLTNPELLPIGVELKIPPRNAGQAPPVPKSPLPPGEG